MKRSRFPQPTSSFTNKPLRRTSGVISIVQLVVFGLCITIFAAIFIQNLQPAIQIFFLGKMTLPIPLSVAMLAAFGIGGFLAVVFNAIATWRQNMAIRRVLVAAGSGEEQVRAKPENYKNEQYKNEQYQKYEEDDNLDDLEEEDEDEYLDEKDEDPDTVPYGDRANLKSNLTSKSNSQINSQTKSDRPPLDAKYVE